MPEPVDLVAPSAGAGARAGDDGGGLVLHGFTGNPTAVRPLAQRVAEAGHTVVVPRLPGHGTSWRDLATTTWRDWLREADAALDRVGELPCAVVGLSMGGTLALRLAQDRPADVASLVLINPSMTFRHPLKPALGLLKRVVPTFPGVGNDIARPDADELPYDRVPLRAAASLFELQDAVRDRLREVTAPTLLFTSRNDHTVPPGDSSIVLDHIASARREQVWLDRSFHVATLDYDAEVVADRTIGWLADTVGSASSRAPARDDDDT